MTLFTVISIVIATTGVTYTAISQVRAVLQKRFDSSVEVAGDNRDAIVSWYDDTSGHVRWMRVRAWVSEKLAVFFWKFSAVPPIVALGLFSFLVAYKVILTIDLAADGADPNALVPSDAFHPTFKTVEFYGVWLKSIIVTDVVSIVVMSFAFIVVEIVRWYGNKVMKILGDQKPKNHANITPPSPAAESK